MTRLDGSPEPVGEPGAGSSERRPSTSRLTLAPAPRAVREARGFVEDCCRAEGLEGDAVETAVLLTSETVTNAFLHGRSDARLAVTVIAGVILIQVGDDDSRLPALVEQHPDAVSGRGVMILESLATRWGIGDDAQGKVVWFEVSLDP